MAQGLALGYHVRNWREDIDDPAEVISVVLSSNQLFHLIAVVRSSTQLCVCGCVAIVALVYGGKLTKRAASERRGSVHLGLVRLHPLSLATPKYSSCPGLWQTWSGTCLNA